MRVVELKKDSIVKECLQTANVKPNTEKSYLQGMQEFTEFTGKSPKTILEEAEADTRNGLLMRQRRIKTDLIGFRAHLQESGIAPYSIKNRIVGVKSFFATFDIEIPRLPHIGKATTLEKNIKIPGKDDLQAVLKVADPLEKAILLTAAASGLAANELCELRVYHFKQGYDPDSGITTLRLRRQKVGFDFVTFLTPEASQAVLDYLSFRNRKAENGRTRKKEVMEKQNIKADGNFLFIRRQVQDEYLRNYDDNLRKFDTKSLIKAYRIIAEKSQKETPVGDWGFIRSHNIRKFFNSALLNAGADSFFVEFTMGHTLDETRAAYFRAAPEKLKEIYKKYIPFLTIAKENSIEETAEFKQLNEEVTRLKGENETLKLDRFENEALKKLKEDINELKREKAEREAMRREFEPISTEDKQEWEKIDRLCQEIAKETGMTPDEVYENLNIASHDSETMQKHLTRLHNDVAYRKKFYGAFKMAGIEKKEIELGRKALKTLADSL